MFKFDVLILCWPDRYIKMDNPAVLTFCRESLRSCYTILGREGFQAEVDYLLRCYAGVGVGADDGAASCIIRTTIGCTRTMERGRGGYGKVQGNGD